MATQVTTYMALKGLWPQPLKGIKVCRSRLASGVDVSPNVGLLQYN